MTMTDARREAPGAGREGERAAARGETGAFAGLPTHVWVLFGASTAGYALMLAGVAAFQSNVEAGLIAARQPAVDGLAQLTIGHDALAGRIDAASGAYGVAVDAYAAAGSSVDTLHSQVGLLAGLVAEIDGVSRSMPDAVKLPAVRKTVTSTRSPSTSGTTGASGG